MAIQNDQLSFYESNILTLGRNELNLDLNPHQHHHQQQISTKASLQEVDQELPLPLSPFTDSDTSSVRRGSLTSTLSYSPNIPQTPLLQQQSLKLSSNPNRLSSNSIKNNVLLIPLNRISTESLGDQSTVRGSKRDSMNLSPMSANSEASGSTFIPPKELMVRDKSVRLSQTTVSSQSSGNKKEGALENWKTWAKEIEDRAGRTDSSSSPRDESDPSGSNDYSTTTITTTTTTTTITTPRSSPPLSASPSRNYINIPSIQTSSPSIQTSPTVSRSPHITVTQSYTNPLAPYRKKLSRSLSSGKRVSIEIQLLVELVDALESFIKSFTTASDAYNASFRSKLSNSTSTPLPTENPISIGFMTEVISLLKELIEVAPSVQKCIQDGAFGPLANLTLSDNSSPPTANLLNWSMSENYSVSTWWPRRLAKDLRKVLEEVGFPTVVALKGGTSTNSNSYLKELQSSSPTNRREGTSNFLRNSSSGGEENDPISPSSPSSPISPRDSPATIKRKEELMIEGRKRWEAFRKRQQAAGVNTDTVY